MAAPADRALHELVDRQAMADLRVRYCRGVDRCDVALMRSVFWPDAVAHYGIYNGSAVDFAELTVKTVREACQATMHLIANVTVNLQDDWAAGETYVVAYHSIKSIESIGQLLEDAALSEFRHSLMTESGPCSFVVGSRYLDRFTRRNGEWRIQERSYVWDWCEKGPANLMFHALNSGTQLRVGQRDIADASYACFRSAPI
jgi:hypothetical protein